MPLSRNDSLSILLIFGTTITLRQLAVVYSSRILNENMSKRLKKFNKKTIDEFYLQKKTIDLT